MISCTLKKSYLHYTDFPAKIKGILHVFLHDFLFSPSCISVAQCLYHAVENAYRAFGSCKFFPPGWPHTRRPSEKAAFPPEGGPAAHALYDYFFSEASNSSMLVPFSFSADSSSWYC